MTLVKSHVVVEKYRAHSQLQRVENAYGSKLFLRVGHFSNQSGIMEDCFLCLPDISTMACILSKLISCYLILLFENFPIPMIHRIK